MLNLVCVCLEMFKMGKQGTLKKKHPSEMKINLHWAPSTMLRGKTNSQYAHLGTNDIKIIINMQSQILQS